MIRVIFELSPQESNLPAENWIYKKSGLNKGDFDFEIRKKSLDARKSKVKFVYTVDLFLKKGNENKIASRLKGKILPIEEEYSIPTPSSKPTKRPIVAGFGPAGIFAALTLARSGFCPIVLERGKNVDERKKDVDDFFNGGQLNINSNIQFGEGGAGTFSDGKLNTLVKDKSFRGQYVLKELVKAGAPEETLYIAKPHIGTDLLREVVKNIRKEIISLGGEIHFNTKLEDIKTDNEGNLISVIANGKEIETDALFLATGQSAKDIAVMLYNHSAEIEKKPFSIGFRIEHPQKDIDVAQYGDNDDLPFLPPAEYKLFTHCKTGRTVYSFCMCPGGHVVNASSEENQLVTNGMSYHARNGKNANSAILCEILPQDLDEGIFSGFDYRERLERLAFNMGGSDYTAPASALGDYLGETKNAPLSVEPTYPRGIKLCDISKLFSAEINASFREAFKDFGRKIKGFDQSGALITAIESRTSSPIRIKRFDDRQSNIKGIYPLGEGAGYAGGIISAAIDGLKSAEEYILKF